MNKFPINISFTYLETVTKLLALTLVKLVTLNTGLIVYASQKTDKNVLRREYFVSQCYHYKPLILRYSKFDGTRSSLTVAILLNTVKFPLIEASLCIPVK